MLKKINLFLIIISIIGSLYFAITRDKEVIHILKDLSIVITINALYILSKISKTKFDDSIYFIYIVFIFIAHFLGVICELYSKIYWFDKFVHFLSGVVSSFGAIILLYKFKNNKKLFFNVIFIIAFTLMAASLWEVFEYTSSILFDVDPQKVVLTGVHDTMGDIIVAFFGSIIVSTWYLYEKNSNKNLVISSFINKL